MKLRCSISMSDNTVDPRTNSPFLRAQHKYMASPRHAWRYEAHTESACHRRAFWRLVDDFESRGLAASELRENRYTGTHRIVRRPGRLATTIRTRGTLRSPECSV
jgi:hypothetical protein